MAQLRPYANNTRGDGFYNPVVQSNPKIDMYVKGKLPPHISAKYRQGQKIKINRNPYMDKIHGPLQAPLGTPSAVSMMGSGKHKQKIKKPYMEGIQSRRIAFFNEVGMSAKKKPKPVKGTLGRLGATSVAREPRYHSGLGRYVK
jgi:hypothetical protein